MSFLDMERFAESVARTVPANADRAGRFRDVSTGRRLRFAAHGSAGLALLSAAVSAYWTFGGGALLSTVGGDLEAIAGRGGAAVVALGAGTTAAKLAGGALSLALVRPWDWHLPQRLLDGLAMAAAALPIAYGGLLVLVGGGSLLGLTGSAPAEPTALRWHVLFWDPWFLLWGLLLGVAAVQHRRLHHRDRPAPSTATDRRSRRT
jgi:hypothetical protein